MTIWINFPHFYTSMGWHPDVAQLREGRRQKSWSLLEA